MRICLTYVSCVFVRVHISLCVIWISRYRHMLRALIIVSYFWRWSVSAKLTQTRPELCYPCLCLSVAFPAKQICTLCVSRLDGKAITLLTTSYLLRLWHRSATSLRGFCRTTDDRATLTAHSCANLLLVNLVLLWTVRCTIAQYAIAVFPIACIHRSASL